MVKFASSNKEHQLYEDAVVLAELDAVTDTNGDEFYIPDCKAVICQVDSGAVTTATLDVIIQTYIGGDWIDICAFTQIVASGVTHIAKLVAPLAQAMFLNAPLAAGNIRNLFGTRWRCRWAVADGTGALFTCKIQPV